MKTVHRIPQLSTMLDEVFGSNAFDSLLNPTTNPPKANILENKTHHKIELLVPAFEKTNFSLNIKDGKLHVKGSGNRKETSPEQKETRREFVVNDFSRAFILPKNIDAKKINASYLNGVLTITIPKKEIEDNQITIEVQ